MTNNTPLGVIEGFFGRSWSWQQRRQLANFLRLAGYHFYLYAPKSDAKLRSRWREDWTPSDWQALSLLRQHYKTTGIEFGIGLSPLDLCTPNGGTDSASLKIKIERINQLQPDILALLFDDMRGDIPQLASRQVELAHCAAELSNAKKILLCPTYYSDDPVLEKVFGVRPETYWETLGQQLDQNIGIFWTGPKVCTPRFTRSHLSEVSDRLQRHPFLWDNYPVNDGAVKSKHLYLEPFGADRAAIGDLLAGHAVNPMNQYNLSKLALASLPYAYQEAQYHPSELFAQLLQQHCPPAMGEALAKDARNFSVSGLGGMSEQQRAQLAKKYRQIDKHTGMGNEVADWLEGHYTFDPDCLTE